MKQSTAWRESSIELGALGVVALVALVASRPSLGPLAASMVLAAMTLVPSRFAPWAGVAGALLCAYFIGLGTSGNVLLPVLLGAALALATALLRGATGVLLATTGGMVLGAAFLARRALRPEHFQDAREAALRLAAAALCVLLVACWVGALRRGGHLAPGRMRQSARWGGLALGLVGVSRALVIGSGPSADWERMAQTLGGTPPSLDSPRALLEVDASLARLAAAGAGDAARARVVMGAALGRSPAELRSICAAQGSLIAFPQGWARLAEQGAVYCAALADEPMAGASRLDGAGLSRWLAAELAVEAGALEQAVVWFRESAAAGHERARTDALAALAQRGRHDLTRALAESAPPADAASREGARSLWLGESGASAWTAWSALLDFATGESAARRGIRSEGRAAELFVSYDPDERVTVLSARSRDPAGVVLRLPDTPARELPGRLRVRGKSKGGFRLEVAATDGRKVIATCEDLPALANERIIRLDSPFCGGAWGEVVIDLAGVPAGTLESIRLYGAFALARVSAEERAP